MTRYRVILSMTWECEAADEWDAENVASDQITAAIDAGEYRFDPSDMAAVVERFYPDADDSQQGEWA